MANLLYEDVIVSRLVVDNEGEGRMKGTGLVGHDGMTFCINCTASEFQSRCIVFSSHLNKIVVICIRAESGII